MRKIIHLSDLHFGTEKPALLVPLRKLINRQKPDLIIISGDITMRAKIKQFVSAKAFLDSLNFPKFFVPGNHDIPLYNLYTRFFKSLVKYKKYITEDLAPKHLDKELAIFGVNTIRTWQVMRGWVDKQQIKHICQEIEQLPQKVIKIIVSHHPFDLPAKNNIFLIRSAEKAMKDLINAKADLFMAGHAHASVISHVPAICQKLDYNSLVIQAGTAISARTRRENNAFNILKLDYPNLEVSSLFWDETKGSFQKQQIQKFAHTAKGWKLKKSA